MAEHLPQEYRDLSRQIIALHLNEGALAMPRVTPTEAERAILAMRDGASVDEIINVISMEDGKTREGMFRVLVRTHLNRSGINNVSMGYKEKTLSPRILNFSDTIDIEKPICEISNQVKFLEDWATFASQHFAHADPAVAYDERGRDTLVRILHGLPDDGLAHFVNCRSGKKLRNHVDGDLGWCRIILGIFTGLRFLQEQQWSCFKTTQEPNLNANEINRLIKDCSHQVVQYGHALAGSFYADLGSTRFVKDDTHVRACMMAIDSSLTSVEDRVNNLIICSDASGIAPRIMDKLFYTACSGNLPLLGLKLERPQVAKATFIERLAGCCD